MISPLPEDLNVNTSWKQHTKAWLITLDYKKMITIIVVWFRDQYQILEYFHRITYIY